MLNAIQDDAAAQAGNRRNDMSVLFVTYHFPPDSEVGGRRIARLAAFLHGRGWDVGVLTVKEGYYAKLDRSFSQTGFRVYRTSMMESARFILGRIKSVTANILRRNNAMIESADTARIRKNGSDQPNNGNPLAVAKRFILSLVWCPDDRQGWIPFGAPKCFALSRRYKLIYSSSPPYSAALIPLFACAFRPRTIWVAEFRDPWTASYKPAFAVSSFSKWLEARLERAVLARCSRIVVVNEAMRNDFAARHPSCADKIIVAANGFDLDQIGIGAERDAVGPRRQLIFMHAGSLYQGRDPSVFLEAVAALIEERALDPQCLEIVFAGDSEIAGKSIASLALELGIAPMVRVVGYMPYEQCMESMKNADVLLLFNIDQPLQVPAKFYEYIGMRKRVLCLSTGGITDELIARTKIGICVHPKDREGIKRAILSLMAMSVPVGDPIEIMRFHTSSIFGELALRLEAFVEHTCK